MERWVINKFPPIFRIKTRQDNKKNTHGLNSYELIKKRIGIYRKIPASNRVQFDPRQRSTFSARSRKLFQTRFAKLYECAVPWSRCARARFRWRAKVPSKKGWIGGGANRSETYPDGGCSPIVDEAVGCPAILREERRAEARRHPRSLASIQRRPSVPSPFDVWPHGASPGVFRDRNSSVFSAESRARNTENRAVVVGSSRLLQSNIQHHEFWRILNRGRERFSRSMRKDRRGNGAKISWNRSWSRTRLITKLNSILCVYVHDIYIYIYDFCILIVYSSNRTSICKESVLWRIDRLQFENGIRIESSHEQRSLCESLLKMKPGSI